MIDVGRAPAQVRAAVLALKRAGRDLRSDINKATRAEMTPVWKSLVESAARTSQDTAVLAKGARIKAGNPPAGQAATSRRALSGGLKPADNWQSIEFGADRNKTSTYTRKSKNGGSHQVTRHASKQLPQRIRTGRVVYPALAQIGPRLASLWVQIIVRKYAEAAEETR